MHTPYTTEKNNEFKLDYRPKYKMENYKTSRRKYRKISI